MAEIHPSAIVEGEVDLADDVVIGPQCVIRGPVRVGVGTRLVGHAYLEGPLELGERNRVYPFTTLGMAPQDYKWDPDRAGAGLVVGDENIFRESVTIHRATSDETPTRIGHRNMFMVNTHAGHDAVVGSDCVFANGVLLAGEVEVGDAVVVGGNAAIHQLCRVGRGSLISGTMGLNKDLPPFFMLTGGNIAGSINVVGMRRAGMPSNDIDDVRWAFKVLYRRGLRPKQAVAELETRGDRPRIAELLAFIGASKRGLVPGVGQARRGTA